MSDSRNTYAIQVLTPDAFGGAPRADWLRGDDVLQFPTQAAAETVAAALTSAAPLHGITSASRCAPTYSVRVYSRRLTA